MRTLIQDVEVRWHWQQYIFNVAKASRAKKFINLGNWENMGNKSTWENMENLR